MRSFRMMRTSTLALGLIFSQACSHAWAGAACSGNGTCPNSDEGTYLLQRRAQGGLFDGLATEEEEHAKSKARRTGGAKWSATEIKAIQKTLEVLFSNDRGSWEHDICELLGHEEYPCQLERLDPNRLESCDSENITDQADREDIRCNGQTKKMSPGAIPTAPKFLRLGFHDCVRYQDGSGGCDGCLNFHGMFTIYNNDERTGPDSVGKGRKSNLPYDMTSGNNNNLAATADILEEIYTNVQYGKQKDYLTVSLQDSGKSRADLWAFSALFASHFFMEKNNKRCWSNERPHLYNEPTMNLPHECAITPARAINFYTGRSDCPESDKPAETDRHRDYETAKAEKGANAHASGKEVAAWFASEFGFSGRETVAIMGAHQAGKYNAENAFFRYSWGGRELDHEDELNNLYYRMMAYKPIYMQDDLTWIANYTAEGKPAPAPRTVDWEMNPRNICPDGGPVQWHMFSYVDAGSPLYMNGERLHITFLNTDMGLYLDFNVTAGGHPIRTGDAHCTTLGTSVSSDHRMMPFDVAESSCKQSAPGGDGKTLAEIVEEYADDQNKWWDDYVEALEKMVSNGYNDLELSGPLSTTTTTTTTTTDQSSCTKKHCCGGIKKKQVCCAGECGKCGGGGCKDRPGGKPLCCQNTIEDAGVMCTTKTQVGCIIP